MHLVNEKPLKPKRRKSFIGQSVIVIACLYLVFVTAFTSFSLPTATLDNFLSFMEAKANLLVSIAPLEVSQFLERYCPQLKFEPAVYKVSSYCALAPLSIALGYVLGARMAVLSVLFFIILGLTGPWIGFFPLANGGGLNYYTEPTFGYLIGLVLAAYVSGKITKEKRTSLSQSLAIIAGCACIHISGVVYLFGTYLLVYLVEGSKTFFDWQPWIFQYVRNLTWYSLPYDVIFSLILVGLAFPFRWFVDTMTIRNNHTRQRKPDRKLELKEEVGV